MTTAAHAIVESAAPEHRRLADVFQENHDFVWRVVASMGTPAGLVDDIVQEVFIVVARKLPTYEERGTLRAWLAAIVRRVLADQRKKAARASARERAAWTPVVYGDPERTLARREGAAVVQRFINELPEAQAEVFVLMELEGLSAPEVAGALGLKVNTVYSRLRLARRRFDVVCRQWRAERSNR